MPLDTTKPFKIVYENNMVVIYQDGKKYNLSGIEIEEKTTQESQEVSLEKQSNEPVATQTADKTDSSTQKPRSRK